VIFDLSVSVEVDTDLTEVALPVNRGLLENRRSVDCACSGGGRGTGASGDWATSASRGRVRDGAVGERVVWVGRDTLEHDGSASQESDEESGHRG
jgi:hypothetical protein